MNYNKAGDVHGEGNESADDKLLDVAQRGY
jgi:hypothetical protein